MTTLLRNNFEEPDFTNQVVKVLTRVVERRSRVRDVKIFMREMWKRSVKAVGKHQAKEIMREIMGDKEPGPRKTDEDNALDDFIRAYISHCGPKQGDEKIAKRLRKSKPYYVQWDSGAIVVASDEFETEINSALVEYPKAKRTPINKGLPALKKQVERVRRQAIEDGLLGREFAPKIYRRDQ